RPAGFDRLGQLRVDQLGPLAEAEIGDVGCGGLDPAVDERRPGGAPAQSLEPEGTAAAEEVEHARLLDGGWAEHREDRLAGALGSRADVGAVDRRGVQAPTAELAGDDPQPRRGPSRRLRSPA